MSKQKPARNKKYTPRPAHIGGGLHAVALCHARYENKSPLHGSQLTDLGAAYWLSFDGLTSGAATEEQWSCVVCALNIAMVLSENGIGSECNGDIVAALDGAFRGKIRSARTGNFRLDGDAITAITTALHWHDQQMQVAHRNEVVTALESVMKRVSNGQVYEIAA
tara:strand:- start:53 stop:547 length:495 start_codon:yes stop_codon:yes gene_type:complete